MLGWSEKSSPVKKGSPAARVQSQGPNASKPKPSLKIKLCTEGKPLRAECRWITVMTLGLKDKEPTSGSGQRRQKENLEKTKAKASRRDWKDVSVAKRAYHSSIGPEFWAQCLHQAAPRNPSPLTPAGACTRLYKTTKRHTCTDMIKSNCKPGGGGAFL